MPNNTQRYKKVNAKGRAFLAAFRECGNITQAAEIVGINRAMHYEWMVKVPEYPALFEAAQQHAADRLEQEARRRAIQGVGEPVFYKGEECGTIQRYSDTLLIFLLKGALPDKYKDRVQQEQSGHISHQHIHDLRKLSPEKLAQLEAILQPADSSPEDA